MKKFVLSLIISCGAITASALPNVNNLRDTITDNDIVAPHSFETVADSLAKNWYYQQYVTLSAPKETEITARTIAETPSDELYIQRLQYLQNEGGFTIEMHYNSVVKSYIEMYTGKRRRSLVEKMLGMWLYYEPIFETALLKENIPTELKYLPIIESALNPNAVSPAAAAGLWQFIPSTGKGMGLEINSLVDERRDTYKASQKAAEFLKQLYNTYGDWSLVIAAYNCGPGNVNKAIRRAGGGKKDFWEIYNFLPKETRGYVPAFIAAAYVMNFHNEHGISTSLANKPLLTDTVQVKRRINFKQIADVIDIDVNAIEALNPQYLKNTIPAGPTKPYTLILPSKYCYMYVMSEDIIGTKDAEKYKPRETENIPSGEIGVTTLRNNAMKGLNVESGYEQEMAAWAYYCINGADGIAKDYYEAVKILKILVERDENRVKADKFHYVVEGYNMLGNCYEKGFGVQKNIDKARGYWQQAAKYNHADAQEKLEMYQPKPAPEQIFTAVEQKAVYPGGDAALLQWISSNIQYPTMAQEEGIEGRVFVKFVVEKDGSIGKVEVSRGKQKDLDAEAVRVVKKIPKKFTPAKQHGQAVRSWFTLPVTFKRPK